MKTDKMYLTLNEQQRNELKQRQLELLDEFATFCFENHLTFYLFGGTLLGAVRHKGFIPWDDDIDVCMPREDYDRFCELYPKKDKYFLQTVYTDKYYFYHFAKLMQTDTIYNELYTKNIKTKKHIFIDIFPINGIPSHLNKFKRFHYYFWLFLFHKKSYPSKLINSRKMKRSFSYVVMSILTWALLWWMPYHKAAIKKNAFMKKHQYPNSDSCIVGTNLRKVYKKSFFCGCSVVMFEGRKMSAPENIQLYLTKMYGDYKQLPPKEERVPHHYVVDFKA